MISMDESVGTGADHSDGTRRQEPVIKPQRAEPAATSADAEAMTAQLRIEDTEMPESSSVLRKRKSPESCSDSSLLSGEGSSKKVKLAEDHAKQPSQLSICSDKSLLPAEIWHQIFTFCPPKSLGNLLRVNKLFNLYLDPSSSVHKEVPVFVARGALVTLKAAAIWRASRRLFWPQMPAPLRSRREIDMWRLACSSRCQDCNKVDDRDRSSPSDVPRPGPGVNGVAIIWPFAVRVCAPCLLQKSIKELDLLVSPSIPSTLLTALPWVYLTTELHVLPDSTIEPGQLPAGLQVTRLFLRSDVELLEQEFSKVKDMGSGTVDEWLKGLAGRGKDARQQASKWEKWASSGGVAKMLSQLYPGYHETPHQPSAQAIQEQPAVSPVAAVPSGTLPPIPPPPFSHVRQERTAEEVAQLKATRKAEIERRALLLDPPLPPNILRHIPSFQAATHIITPLDDNAWELLKPRLLAQRAEAEACEAEIMPCTRPIQEPAEHHALEETLATTKEARELIDKDWEVVQAPLRAKIAGYADETIRDNWGKGKKVVKDTCSKFAVDVLVHVRKRFYAEIAKEAAAAWAAGKDPPVDPSQGPFTQKLTLENMKWIFDTKIKPLTEPHRKELFYCSACEGNPKSFGFEGVIQHYAAKHTTALSLGSIVVHWRAEWPEQVPFGPEARPAKPPFHSQVPASFTGSAAAPPTGYSYPLTPAPLATPPYPPPASFGAPAYADPYHHQPPPQPYQPHASYPTFIPPTSYGPQPPYVAYPGPGPYAPYPPSATPLPPGGSEPVHPYHPPTPNPVYGPYHGSAPAPYPSATPPAYPDGYQAKLEDVARNSREVWQTLGNIKDLPGSARVFITIHHLVKRFRSRFYEALPLLLFIDGLSNIKEMRPVRNINGLVCKTCHFGLGNAASVQEDRKSFSLPQLTNHFQSKHVEPMHAQGSPPLDWVLDMVLLVDQANIPKLRFSMSEYQKSLVADAFPGIFDPLAPLASSSYQTQQAVPPQRKNPTTYSAPPVSGYGKPPAQLPNPGAGGVPERVHHVADGAPHEAAPGFRPQANHSGLGQPRQYTPQHPENRGPDSYPESGYVVDRAGAGSAHSRVLTDVQTSDSSNGRTTPQGRQHRNDQGRQQPRRKSNGRNRRGNHPGGENGRGFGEEEEEIQSVWAIDRTETARIFPSGGRDGGGRGAPYSPPPAQVKGGVLQRFGPPSPKAMAAREEPSLLGALERHLDQRQPPPHVGRRQGSIDRHYSEGRSAAAVERGEPPWSYAQHEPDMERPRTPYEAKCLSAARQGPLRYPAEPPFHSRPVRAEKREVAYENDHPQLGVGEEEVPGQRWESARHSRPRSPSNDRVYEAEARPGPYRYPESAQPLPRQAVEAYEIVQVIDERGEYYIKRPILREPEPRYVSEHDYGRGRVGRYAGQEPYYEPSAVRDGRRRDPLPPDAPRDAHAAAGRGGLRTNPGYYEEYDPRFPSA